MVVLEPLLGESLSVPSILSEEELLEVVRDSTVGGFCVCFGSSPPPPSPLSLSQLLTLDHPSVCSKAPSVIWRGGISRVKR